MKGVAIGAGDRGFSAYAPLLLRRPELGRFAAVAEPHAGRRAAFARRYGVPAEGCFADYRELLEGPRRGDFAIVATPDALHVEPALLALERGYHVLLEKPMAPAEEDCHRLVAAAARADRLLQACHVLRYAPLFRALADAVAAGELGDVVTIQHSENVSHWHYAHSYCRGSWRNASASAPMILAKSCHDLDLLYWFAGADPVRLASLARPCELVAENAPPDAPEYCVEGCPHAARCPYDATAMYRHQQPILQDLELTRRPRWARPLVRLLRRHRPRLDALEPLALRGYAPWTGWPVSVISDDATPAGVERALRTTRYGRCVYRVGDNDQVSSQTVAVQFANGANASFTMHGTSYREGRETRIDGTRGSAVGRFYQLEQWIEVVDHKTGRRREQRFPVGRAPHGGGDVRLFADFLAALRGETEPVTSAAESLQSHRMAFAADRAAREGRVVELGPVAEPARARSGG